jgi:S1-C subfamily serine protease
MTQDDKGVTRVGDIIISIDGHQVRQIDDIIDYIETQKSVGDTVKLKVNRNGNILDITAKLTPRAAPAPSQQQQSPQFGLPQLPQIPEQPQLPFIP